MEIFPPLLTAIAALGALISLHEAKQSVRALARAFSKVKSRAARTVQPC